MSREEVVKAMETIRDWCESRDALEDCCVECPFGVYCRSHTPPCSWEVDE